MVAEHSVDTCRKLEARFRRLKLLRPMRVQRYEPEAKLSYDITGVFPARPAHVRLQVQSFVGGGFAGQVYRVRILRIDAPRGPLPGLEVGGTYALKILVPATGFQRRFRNLVYWLGFQGPFQPQVNPAAARAGALWQKLIRRGAKVRFGTEQAVVNVLATFVDPALGSCAELSEWVDGRQWRFEVDDRLLARWRWRVGQPDDHLGSPEYRAKKAFLAGMVELMHEMGAPELARQYEWWTCKSQPNALKRRDTDDDPHAGLTAVDFRAGLALLPYLPMSPADVPLIFKGLARGSLVQFDRGNLNKLRRFVEQHAEHFTDMQEALAELESVERVYRSSVPDIAHNHIRLLYSPRLWSTIRQSTITGWKTRNIVDAETAERFRRSRFKTHVFLLVGLLGGLSALAGLGLLAAGVVQGVRGGWGTGVHWLWSWPGMLFGAALVVPVPKLLRLLRKVWGRADVRHHLQLSLTSREGFSRALRGRIAEKLIVWHRDGRVRAGRAQFLVDHPFWFFAHLPFSILPAGLHRLFTDTRYARRRLSHIFVRPVRLYFNAEARERWLRGMVADGRKHHILTEEDARTIESQLQEPYIQKYLKSLAVHICTLPVTQVVSVIVALVYVRMHPELNWEQAWGRALVILAAFQVTPISPGSLVRGLYVLYLVLRERNFKDYNIAVFVGFFKYVGYLAFPLQMAYRYPALARFMAAHWATRAVHIVPVFGERGALLEHSVFDMFYNYPLSVRRRAKLRQQRRRALRPRRWHVPVCGLAAGAVLAGIAWLHLLKGRVISTWTIWYAALGVPLLAGVVSARWAGGQAIGKRIAMGAVAGLVAAGTYAAVHTAVYVSLSPPAMFATFRAVWEQLGRSVMWPAFLFPIVGLLGAAIAEVSIPEPKGLASPESAT